MRRPRGAGSPRVVEHARDQRRGRLAQQPLDVRQPEQPAGRRLQRRPADVDQRGQRGGQLGVAHVGERLGDGRVRAQDHRLGRHHAAGGLLDVRHQPADVLGLLGLHQRQQRSPRSPAAGRRSGRRRRRATSPRGCRRPARSRGARGSRPGPPPAAPRARRPAARRPAPRPPRSAAPAGRSCSMLAASAGRISLSAAIRWVAPWVASWRVRPSTSRHSATWVWPRRRSPLAGSWTATRLSTQSRLRACSMADVVDGAGHAAADGW